MPITAAEYTNINEDQLRITYDSGKIWFVSVCQGSRFEQEMIDQPIIPTAFLAVPGRLDEAKAIARNIIKSEAYKANSIITASDGTYSYNITDDKTRFLGASDTGVDLADDTDTIRTLSAGEVVALKQDWESSWEANQSSMISEYAAIDAAISVAAIDALLAASAFGDFSPVYPS